MLLKATLGWETRFSLGHLLGKHESLSFSCRNCDPRWTREGEALGPSSGNGAPLVHQECVEDTTSQSL